MSWRQSCQSKEMDSVNSATSAAGPLAKRPLRETGEVLFICYRASMVRAWPKVTAKRVCRESICMEAWSNRMSEFKFACPVCGQHLTASPGNSGAAIECPTCFRAIVVPQAPASGESKLIMSAVQAGKPKTVVSGPLAAPTRTASRQLWGYAAGFLVAGTVCALGFAFFGEKLWSTRKKEVEESQVRFEEKLKNPKVPAWTLDPSAAIMSRRPLSGMINGQPFTCDRAVLRGTNLVFRQGSGSPPELAITISLLQAVTNALQVRVASTDPPPVPQVVVRSKNENGQAVNKIYKSGCLITLVLDAPVSNIISGKVYVAVPDESQSFVAGTFSADILHTQAPRRGQRAAGKRQGLRVETR